MCLVTITLQKHHLKRYAGKDWIKMMLVVWGSRITDSLLLFSKFLVMSLYCLYMLKVWETLLWYNSILVLCGQVGMRAS